MTDYSSSSTTISPARVTTTRSAEENLRAGRRCYSRTGACLSVMLLLYVLLPSALAAALALLDVELTPLLSILISSISFYGVAIPLFALLMRRKRDETRAPIVQKKMSLEEIALAFLLCFPLLYLGSSIGSAVDSLLSRFAGSGGAGLDELTEGLGIGYTFLFVVILAPIFEELAFRKVLLDRVARYGSGCAIALSGLSFALFHGNFTQFFYALFLGCFFAFLYLHTGRVRYTIALHMMVNFVGSILPMLFLRLPGISNILAGEEPTGPSLTSALILAGYGLWILALIIGGIVLFIVYRKRFRLPPAPAPEGEVLRVERAPGVIDYAPAPAPIVEGGEARLLLAPGILVFLLLAAAFFLMYLFL